MNVITSQPLSIGEVGTTLTDAQKDFILKRLHFDSLINFDKLPPQATFIFEKIEQITTKDAIQILKIAVEEHKDDVNVLDDDEELWENLIKTNGVPESILNKNISEKIHLDHHKVNFEKQQQTFREKIGSYILTNKMHEDRLNASTDEIAIESGKLPSYYKIFDWDLQVRLEAVLIAYWSPYPQVRAVVDPYDDPNIPVETVRVYIVAALWTGISAVINQFFRKDNLVLVWVCLLFRYFCTPLVYSWSGYYLSGRSRSGNGLLT